MKRQAEDGECSSCKRQNTNVSMKTYDYLPKSINYWMASEDKHDCFFNVGQEPEPIERIGAVKILLMGHSEVLQKMLDGGECALAETGDISVPDSDPETFKNWLVCVYGGTDILLRKLPFEKSLKLLYLCEKYLLLELKEKISSCILEMYQPLSFDNVITSLLHPVCLESESLAKAISSIIQKRTDEFLNCESFLNLDSNAVEFIAKQEIISTVEVTLWRAVLKWATIKGGAAPNDLRCSLKNIIPHIRFCTMKAEDFCRYVAPSDVLTCEETTEICKSIGTQDWATLDKLNCAILSRFRSAVRELTFTHVVNNIKTFSGVEKSLKFKLGHLKWYILFGEDEILKQNRMKIVLFCSPIEKHGLRFCCANAEVVIMNHNKLENYKLRMLTRLFNKTRQSHEFSIGRLQDLLKIENGFVKNNSIEIMVRVIEMSSRVS